jgi:c-di-GMP-binding flagellar brake protein YcgR
VPSEKRRTPRIQPYVAPCRVATAERRLRGYLADLSPAGARVSCDGPAPAPGTRVELEVRLGAQLRQFRLPAEVKWIRADAEGRHVFGLTFGDVGADARAALESVVEEFRRRAELLR